jgi:hypothetical protein
MSHLVRLFVVLLPLFCLSDNDSNSFILNVHNQLNKNLSLLCFLTVHLSRNVDKIESLQMFNVIYIQWPVSTS